MPRKSTALFLALALAGSPALSAASDYFVVTPMPGKATESSEGPIEVVLNAAALPEAAAWRTYRYDLVPLLSVTGDPNYSPSSVRFTASGLPPGLSLSAAGILSGIPSGVGQQQIHVVATYKARSGEREYTVRIGDSYIKIKLEKTELPIGTVAEALSYDFKPHLLVSNDDSLAEGVTPQAEWSATGLPEGLSISQDGVVSGSPTVKTDPAGKPVWVTAQYKDEQTVQMYTLIVHGKVLRARQVVTSHGGTTCALTIEGSVLCWGNGYNGALGNGLSENSLVPVRVLGLQYGVTALSKGAAHFCAIQNGGVKCWGNNTNGQLGDGSNLPSAFVVNVRGLENGVTAISTNSNVSCAVQSGAAKCWGSGAYNQLGTGSQANQYTPVTPNGMAYGVTDISVGMQQVCAVQQGAAKCWGSNNQGQLGDGTYTARAEPTQVTGLTSGVSRVESAQGFSCAVVNGRAMCWGGNVIGQTGSGLTDNVHPTPQQVAGLTSGVTKITSGSAHACALHLDTVKCWGTNTDGLLGDGSGLNQSRVPVQVAVLTNGVTDIASSQTHNCGIQNEAIRCWGQNSAGGLGDGTTQSRMIPGQPVDAPSF